MSNWSINDARKLYHLAGWSSGYFDINQKGQLVMSAGCNNAEQGLVLSDLAKHLADTDLNLPILIRFEDVLEKRVSAIIDAFKKARQQYGYQGDHTAVYPIKVNQQHAVIEQIVADGGEQIGLEAGSKAELLVVLGMSKPGSVIVCNGYKDREYIQLALLGQVLGKRVYIVIEKPNELLRVIEQAEAMQIKPLLGVRVRLATIAKGNWQNTGGEKGKFGLTATEVLSLIKTLKKNNQLDCLDLLHFHMGSQISDINDTNRGLKEAAQYFAELKNLGVPLNIVDVGGGLGVDYEGVRSEHYHSINYHLQDYAECVIKSFKFVCDEHGVPHPAIFTESGRAMTAHHAMVITDVVDTENRKTLAKVTTLFTDIMENEKNDKDRFLAAEKRLKKQQEKFNHGKMQLEERAKWEQDWLAFCQQLLETTNNKKLAEQIQEKIADKFFLNLSFFQSIPDVWGLDQVFPVLPLQRLNERPDRLVVLQDLTCDSDGRIDCYAHSGSLHKTLPLHQVRHEEQYLLGIFMVGAYQEILGDMHNLFGDTHAVNVRLLPDGGFELKEIEAGDQLAEILRYVHHEPQQLISRYEKAVAASGLPEKTQQQALKILKISFKRYSYLETDKRGGNA
ncbi:MAG TPA: biosynthetic arginine decarboxylase [Chromatiales bacterium]|nr:biosynthetic arginine decarboxylase [Thiotrichales bacterium]HIP68406.1 biosynthetic arginine decarboxylase [Chromatiales bacterium]